MSALIKKQTKDKSGWDVESDLEEALREHKTKIREKRVEGQNMRTTCNKEDEKENWWQNPYASMSVMVEGRRLRDLMGERGVEW